MSGFQYYGTGMSLTRSCAACPRKTSAGGGGIRLVQGVRQWVCAECKTRIDARRLPHPTIQPSNTQKAAP